MFDPSRPRLARFLELGSLAALTFAWAVWSIHPRDLYFGADGYTFWSGQSYGGTVGSAGSYLYSPAFTQLFSPLRLLPWDAFWSVWVALHLIALRWLAGPFVAPLILITPLAGDITVGNIHLFMAVAIVVGLRYSPAWAFLLLTKVTPGIGVLWFAIRREYKAFVLAAAATLALIIVSLALGGDWRGWLTVLEGGNGAQTFLPLRLALGLGLLWYAAARNLPMFVAVVCWLAVPVPWIDSLCLLLAAYRIGSDARGADAARTAIDALIGWSITAPRRMRSAGESARQTRG